MRWQHQPTGTTSSGFKVQRLHCLLGHYRKGLEGVQSQPIVLSRLWSCLLRSILLVLLCVVWVFLQFGYVFLFSYFLTSLIGWVKKKKKILIIIRGNYVIDIADMYNHIHICTTKHRYTCVCINLKEQDVLRKKIIATKVDNNNNIQICSKPPADLYNKDWLFAIPFSINHYI